tara:strand:+ start:4010 stop:4909 length:900 start_codon:yes stop_codon:yes gene_type:complete
MVTAGQYRLGGFDLTLDDPRTIANVQYILQYFAGNQSGYPNLNINMYRPLGDFSDTSGNITLDNNITISDVQYMLQNFAGNISGYPKVGEFIFLPLGSEPDVTSFPNMAVGISAKYSYNSKDKQITFSLKYTGYDPSGVNVDDSTESIIQGVCIEFDTPSTDPLVSNKTHDVSGGKFYNMASPGTSAMGYGKAALITLDNQLPSDSWQIVDVIPYSPAPRVIKSQIVQNVPLQTEGGSDMHNLILGTCVSIRKQVGQLDDGSPKYVDYAYGIPTENTVLEGMTFAPYTQEIYDANNFFN